MKEDYKIIDKIKISKKGMTLIEVVVALAIVGIIAIAFLPLFSSGFKFLISSGDQMKKMYTKQNTIEQKISEGTTSEAVTLSIVFQGKTFDIKGENMTIETYNLFITKK